MKTTYILMIGITLLFSLVLGQHHLDIQERKLKATTSSTEDVTDDGIFEDKTIVKDKCRQILFQDTSSTEYVTGDGIFEDKIVKDKCRQIVYGGASSCPQKKKCKKKGGRCQTKGICPGESSGGCSKKCSCCLPIPTVDQCNASDGFCLETGDRCTGTIKVLHNTCKDQCTCCVPDQQGGTNCSNAHTEIIGKNTTFSTSSQPFTSGLTLGIRIIPEPGQHKIMAILDSDPGYPYGILRILVQEGTCNATGHCSGSFRRWTHDHNYWIGISFPYLPQNEWVLLTITDFHNGSVVAKLQVHEESYSLTIPVSLPNQELTISATAATTNLHSEISLNCSAAHLECIAPWVSIGDRSLGCFLFVQEKMNWDSARENCQNEGGDLAILDAETKRIDMVNYLELSGLKNTTLFWLGANDRSGSWVWLNGNPVTDGWKINQEPDDDAGDDTCIYIYTKPYASGRYDLLFDYYCTHNKGYSICEK